jgi:hypothetical protein
MVAGWLVFRYGSTTMWAMSSHATVLIVCIALASECAIAQTSQKPGSESVRVSPSANENPKVDSNLLQRGTRVVVHGIITKTGKLKDIKFVEGNADLMPEALKAIRTWKYKPYVYHGHPVDVETTIYINFDPLNGGG